MRRHYIMALAILFGASSNGCTPTASPPITTPTPASDITPSGPATTAYRRFSPGTYRYRYSQTAQVQGDGPTDSLPGIITTQAFIQADVGIEPDSSFTVTVSFDSITIDAQGSIPTRGVGQPVRLDSVVRGAFSRAGSTLQSQLPDSLCAYSQFITTARELLLPELGFEIPIPMRKNSADTAIQRACRAGTSIEMTTVRELRENRRNPTEVEVEQQTELHGAGVLRRDSVIVDGSISSRGRIFFSTNHRLPTLIQTESEGTITIQLGSNLTRFRQRSTQRTELLGENP